MQALRTKLSEFFTWLTSSHGASATGILAEVDTALESAVAHVSALEARIKVVEDALSAAAAPKA